MFRTKLFEVPSLSSRPQSYPSFGMGTMRVDSSSGVEQFFLALAKMRVLRVYARWVEGGNPFSYSGVGSVRVFEESPGVWAVEERGDGSSSQDSGLSMSFYNLVRWSVSAKGGLQIEKRRPGGESVVLRLETAGDGLWTSQHPHQCVDDSYSASAEYRGDCIVLHWKIVGPHKSQSVDFEYS